MRFGGEDVDGVHVGVLLATILDPLNVLPVSLTLHKERCEKIRTRNVNVEDGIFVYAVVDNLFGVRVDNQAFPLSRRSVEVGTGGFGWHYVASCDILDLLKDDCRPD